MSFKTEKVLELESASFSVGEQDEDVLSLSEDLSMSKNNGHKVTRHDQNILEPSTTNLSSSSIQAVVCGAKQLNKLKRFITTLLQFANDISPEISECVKNLILNLINSGKFFFT